MKTKMNSLFKEISKEQLDQLTKEVKETLACESNHAQGKIFSSADLWNIQRRRKAISQRQHLA